MKKAKIITAIFAGLALTILAGEAIGQPPGRGRGRQGWGGGPGWGPGIVGRPQMNAVSDYVQPDDSWVPGPYCPWGQGPNQNIQLRQGRGPGGFDRNFQGPRGPYCPYGQGPNQNVQGWQGRGPGRFNRDFQGKGPGGFNQGYQGRGMGPCGRGFGRQDMMMQRGPGAGRGNRGPAIQGRGGRGFQNAGPGMPGRGGRGSVRGNTPPQGWGMNNQQGRLGPGGRGRQGPRMQPRQFVPDNQYQNNQPTTPRGRGWTQGTVPGPRQNWGPNWGLDWTPDWNLKPQPEKAPDANATEPPIAEDQPEQPQGE
jgi:hypothetical protein